MLKGGSQTCTGKGYHGFSSPLAAASGTARHARLAAQHALLLSAFMQITPCFLLFKHAFFGYRPGAATPIFPAFGLYCKTRNVGGCHAAEAGASADTVDEIGYFRPR